MSVLPSPSDNQLRFYIPPDGKFTKEDMIRWLAQQPLDVLPDHLRIKLRGVYWPLTLHFGWMVDDDPLYQYAVNNHPDCVVKYNKDMQDPDSRVPRPHATAHQRDLMTRILDDLNLPNTGTIQVTLFGDKNARIGSGLSLGTNYSGVPANPAYEKKLAELFAKGQPARWYVDLKESKWKVNPNL